MNNKASVISAASDHRFAHYPSAASDAEVATYWAASYRYVATLPDVTPEMRQLLHELAIYEDQTARQYGKAYEADAVQLEALV
jgi:hypothetical protein